VIHLRGQQSPHGDIAVNLNGAPSPLASDSRRSAVVGLRRGAAGRCPNCGRGQLFKAYLKIQPVCDVCGHDNGQYPSDDAPPYFTILIVGHLIIGPLLFFRFIRTWPVGILLALLLPALTVLTLFLLPIVKGAVVGVLWALAKPHSLEGTTP
jgi:uncharacterized protein (DUF983 family)